MFAFIELKEEFGRTTAERCTSPFAVTRRGAAQSFRQLGLPAQTTCICITVYNEAADALCCSLVSLANNARQQADRGAPTISNILIIVDGLENCAASTRMALTRLLEIDEIAAPLVSEMTCYHRRLTLDEIAASVTSASTTLPYSEGQRTFAYAATLDSERPTSNAVGAVALDLVVAIKGQNCGKLDSHWWYYRAFCPGINPLYCFQMDVGTAPAAHAVEHLMEALERDPEVGAVAGNVLPYPSTAPWNLLHCWQYMSFAQSALLEWPAESGAGFLSVVPGQLSGFRWSAISIGDDSESTRRNSGPLDVYFKGLGKLGPYEAMLYAAEDRVLCREIVFSSAKAWKIAHVDAAIAVTDPCHTWCELLMQRKRWCNGYLLCRVMFLKSLPQFISTPGIAVRRKIAAGRAATYHALVLLADWFSLATAILFFQALLECWVRRGGEAAGATAPLPALSDGLAAVWILQLVLCCMGRPSPRRSRILSVCVYIQVGLVVYLLASLALHPGSWGLKALLAFQLLAAPSATCVSQHKLIKQVCLAAPVMFVTHYVISPLLWMFAISNSHDRSWGTKGLVHSRLPRGKAQGETEAGSQLVYLSLWLLSNVLAASFFLWFTKSSEQLLLGVIAWHCFFQAVGLYYRISEAINNKRPANLTI